MNVRSLMLAAVATALLSGGAAAQWWGGPSGPTTKVVVKNDTNVKVNFRRGGGFQGFPSPDFPFSIKSGNTFYTSVPSPFETSSGGSFHYGRDDNMKECFFVYSRTSNSLNGPWNMPIVNATARDYGVTCEATVTNEFGNGGFEVTFTIK